MKKVLLLLIFVCFSFSGIAQELNIPAQFLKEKSPATYEAVKTFAETKWEDDHSMILHEINGQAEAYVGLLQLVKKDVPGIKQITADALNKWTEGEVGEFDNPTTNYKMVVHEIEKQIKAKEAY